jgi:hypothetical protein
MRLMVCSRDHTVVDPFFVLRSLIIPLVSLNFSDITPTGSYQVVSIAPSPSPNKRRSNKHVCCLLVNEKKTKRFTVIYKTLHGKQKIE